jgi:hypothetical protein
VPAFGTPLGSLFAYETKKDPTLQVPLIIGKSLAFLMEKGLNTEGLFRVPGSSGVVNKYKGLFDAGSPPSIFSSPFHSHHSSQARALRSISSTKSSAKK